MNKFMPIVILVIVVILIVVVVLLFAGETSAACGTPGDITCPGSTPDPYPPPHECGIFDDRCLDPYPDPYPAPQDVSRSFIEWFPIVFK